MQDALALLILEAAWDLSAGTQEVLQRIARAATRATAQGPVAVGSFEVDVEIDLRSMHSERDDEGYALGILDWHRWAPGALRRLALSLAPRAINSHAEVCQQLPDKLRAMAREVSPLCVMGNTGDGRGLHLFFGDPELRDWPPARVRHFDAIARHLAAAWRMRLSLRAAATPPPLVAELRPDGTPLDLHPDASTPTSREALRRAVVDRERGRTRRRSAGAQELWPALVAGRWSLLDAFTTAGTRYIVAYENPVGATALRALSAREQRVLELALDGRAGKWIAFELKLSESTVTRTLHAALRRIGAASLAALAGVRTACFEALAGPSAADELAVAALTAVAPSTASLSDAERAILAGILSGQRIAAIARARGTSSRTVGHQLASVYKKLGVSSRRELLALLS